ncbi:MAG: class I SAM-dependent methyltransferase [Burkholderiales bacterium]|nr:class I SAM-dependent methyltransferase [Burkholderiales bacterium]
MNSFTPSESLHIRNMPMYWRIRKPAQAPHAEIPGTFDLTVAYDTQARVVRQVLNEALLSTLEAVYRAESNIGYLQEGHTLAKGYGSDLLAYIDRALADVEYQRVMEVGCGGCLVLSHLRGQGKEVVGVDPSPIAIQAGAQAGIEVVADFFPPKAALHPADLILHSDVLEHVPDPIAFLKSHHAYLNPRGMVLIAVPDCTESIELGDLSMLMHQHLSYFSRDSLHAVVSAAGFRVLDISKSGYGGSLYCLAMKDEQPSPLPAENGLDASYIERAKRSLERVGQRIGQADAGYYMPLRAIPYLSALELQPPYRFFDDTAHWYAGFIDGTTVSIQNFQDLVTAPPAIVHVMSLTFGDLVANKIRSACPELQVTTLRSLLEA